MILGFVGPTKFVSHQQIVDCYILNIIQEKNEELVPILRQSETKLSLILQMWEVNPGFTTGFFCFHLWPGPYDNT